MLYTYFLHGDRKDTSHAMSSVEDGGTMSTDHARTAAANTRHVTSGLCLTPAPTASEAVRRVRDDWAQR